jgi:hypothetical protein
VPCWRAGRDDCRLLERIHQSKISVGSDHARCRNAILGGNGFGQAVVRLISRDDVENLAEPGAPTRVTLELLSQELQGDGLPQLQVVGALDLAHPASSL